MAIAVYLNLYALLLYAWAEATEIQAEEVQTIYNVQQVGGGFLLCIDRRGGADQSTMCSRWVGAFSFALIEEEVQTICNAQQLGGGFSFALDRSDPQHLKLPVLCYFVARC